MLSWIPALFLKKKKQNIKPQFGMNWATEHWKFDRQGKEISFSHHSHCRLDEKAYSAKLSKQYSGSQPGP